MKRLIVAILAVTVGMMTSLTVGGGTAQAAVLETIAVPSDGSSVSSSTSLASGTTYWIRASGAMVIGTICSHPDADAEYYCFSQGAPTDICAGFGPTVDNGIGINDSTNDSAKFPFWGLYNPAHVYTIAFVGLGAPIALNYHDCVYGDNSGSLTVEILSTTPGGVIGDGIRPPPPTPTPPPPPSVGGIAEQPEVAAPPSAAAASGRNYTMQILGVAGAVLAALGAGAWATLRRRRVS